MPEAFAPSVFARLGRSASGPDAVSSCERVVDAMLGKLNRSMWASRLSALRTSFGLNGGEAFLTRGNYVHGSPGHWYVFHRNGRWEPQFNIAMYGQKPGQQPYLRIGLGCALNLASADPEREAGLRQLRSLFMNLQWVARSDKRQLLLNALSLGRPIVESVGAGGPAESTPEGITNWLSALDGHDVSWVFVGRGLPPHNPGESESLTDFDELMFEITRTLDA